MRVLRPRGERAGAAVPAQDDVRQGRHHRRGGVRPALHGLHQDVVRPEHRHGGLALRRRARLHLRQANGAERKGEL